MYLYVLDVPGILFDGLKKTGVTEGVATLGDMGFTENINQISLPFLKAESSGKVMIERCDQVKMVLRYLTELCQGEMFSVDPTLAAQTQRNNTMDWV